MSEQASQSAALEALGQLPPDDRELPATTADEPGGPIHDSPVPAEPGEDVLTKAASTAAERMHAERFSLLFVNVVEDQTPDATDFAQYLTDDFPPKASYTIQEARLFPGNRVIPGSVSLVRSRQLATDPLAFQVQVISRIEAPLFGDSPDAPFTMSTQTWLSVTHHDGWEVSDLQTAGAPRSVIAGGRGWREVQVEPSG